MTNTMVSSQPAPATRWDRPRSPWAPAPSVTPAPVTAPASLVWQGHAVTAACPDTGALVLAAASPATVPGAATLSLAIATAAAAAAGEWGLQLPPRPQAGTAPAWFMCHLTAPVQPSNRHCQGLGEEGTLML